MPKATRQRSGECVERSPDPGARKRSPARATANNTRTATRASSEQNEKSEREQAREELPEGLKKACEEDRHLRVAEIAQQALAGGAGRGQWRALGPLEGPCLRAHRMAQRLQAEVDEVRRSRQLQRNKDRFRGDEERSEPDAGRERPARLADGTTAKDGNAGRAAAEHRVSDRQCRVHGRG